MSPLLKPTNSMQFVNKHYIQCESHNNTKKNQFKGLEGKQGGIPKKRESGRKEAGVLKGAKICKI